MGYTDDVIAHHGVKGMHWGVRKNQGATPARPQAVKVSAPPGKRVKTSGGGGHGISKEARATAAATQKAKASKVHSLTNKELQDAVKRMQLEQQFAQLAKQRTTMGRGKAFIKGLTGAKNDINNVAGFANSPAGKTLKASFTQKAAKAAFIAAV